MGTGPIVGAISFAECLKSFGFEIYFMHNPHAETFLRYLDAFFKATTDQLVVYYVGHGTGIFDTDDTVSHRDDEAFVFDDGIIIEDDLLSHLTANKNPSNELILITDACHSGTIWDIQGQLEKGRELPPQIISISATSDTTVARQTVINRQDQGLFTANLTKALTSTPTLTPNDLAGRLKGTLTRYLQNFTVGTTSPDLLSQPLFS
jgi:hypothetical protein